MIISKFKRELNGDISEILLNTGEVMQNIEYLTDLEEKTITENGTYTPSTGKVGFSKVTVNVPTTGATKLYAWKSAEGILFTVVETLTNDIKIFGCADDRSGFTKLPEEVSSYCTIDTTNNVFKMSEFFGEEQTFERDSEDDISLF